MEVCTEPEQCLQENGVRKVCSRPLEEEEALPCVT